jgi:hypothetical protein
VAFDIQSGTLKSAAVWSRGQIVRLHSVVRGGGQKGGQPNARKRRARYNSFKELAPQAGLEPATLRLTAAALMIY